ncbi:hypothetical protein J2S09_001071 [Bacillus fengqiuensis]|nr:hypothetical protein [Bacillus fengqiuensis]
MTRNDYMEDMKKGRFFLGTNNHSSYGNSAKNN